ncbi:hypothetical protein D9V14_08565 [Staphylococcus epidermidis]|uniref:Uncharacterized protein n=1 Tax=Staphylococcus epidermidis (strain ATCC 12228 / FDA PCI 1200) TaxID=176280 RepID=A0A0H2VGV5_STAES|nr:hypothetical protein SE_1486 [Staphylococcus epidermidis ATCC 12228]KAB2160977.1 hypothetical protein F9B20_05805 [Staphylococcus epidermidis]KAB1896185.1 hypothetical protein F8174_12020 [Staphylococcus epidermidis ATCC 12228]KAB2183062.1 hypothetical protein F9B21_10500 [Staphylococcus epidermidis]KAB2197529.1 hypothetical protein F9B17_05970 [Staphylococcus epidermidis]
MSIREHVPIFVQSFAKNEEFGSAKHVQKMGTKKVQFNII